MTACVLALPCRHMSWSMSTSIHVSVSVAILITTATCASSGRVVAQVVSWWLELVAYVCNWFAQDPISQTSTGASGVPHPNCLGPSFLKMSFISSPMIMVSEDVRMNSTHATGRSFLLVSSRSPRLGFSNASSSATIHTLVQSLMEPSHNDPLSHMPAHLSCNFGALGQPRQQLRRSRSTSPAASAHLASNFGTLGQPRQQLRRFWPTSPATSALRCNSPTTLAPPVNLASNFGAPVKLSNNFGSPGQPCQQHWRTRSTSPATPALPVILARNFGAPSEIPATSALLVNFASNFGVPSQNL